MEYLKEAYRLLSDNATYEILQNDPLPEYKVELTELMNQAFAQGLIQKSKKQFFLMNYIKTPYFYHTPNVHKDPVCPPGRPMVASLDGITSRVSQYVDAFLQPLVTSLPTYIKDSAHVLETLKQYKWEPGYLWLSLDVSSLYTSIPHEGGLRAVEYFLSEADYMNPNQSKFICHCTKFALERNYFSFQGKFYRQIAGTAMGAHFAPCYANLFMGYLEKSCIWQHNPFAKHLVYYGRYIDDILIIWDGPPDITDKFVSYCNNNMFGIQFTHVLDAHSLVFLDLELGSDGDGNITSKTHFKETAGNSYLHQRSCHHPKWKDNIPYSQFCRLRRNCSSTKDYDDQATILSKKFLEKGYADHHIQKATDQYREGIQNKIMTTSAKDQHDILFITTFNDQHWAIKRAVQKHWPILGQDNTLGKILPNKPQVVFRRAKNVKSLIAPSRLKDKQSLNMQNIPQFFNITGCYRCKGIKCKACKFISRGQKSFSCKDGRTFYIKQFICCNTQFVIYGLRCPCGYLYVGRTVRAMRTRFGEQRRFI